MKIYVNGSKLGSDSYVGDLRQWGKALAGTGWYTEYVAETENPLSYDAWVESLVDDPECLEEATEEELNTLPQI